MWLRLLVYRSNRLLLLWSNLFFNMFCFVFLAWDETEPWRSVVQRVSPGRIWETWQSQLTVCLNLSALLIFTPETIVHPTPIMSSHKHNFQCFDAVGCEGHVQNHTSRLPRITQHGMVEHHESLRECYLCSEYRHSQALEALETQATPVCHSCSSYLHHHPHQYVLSRPTRPEEHPMARSGYNQHVHHHRYSKTVVLVKNSDPSFRTTIVLRRRSIHSFSLFLEEVSELMQYHIRKVYTLDGRKVRPWLSFVLMFIYSSCREFLCLTQIPACLEVTLYYEGTLIKTN